MQYYDVIIVMIYNTKCPDMSTGSCNTSILSKVRLITVYCARCAWYAHFDAGKTLLFNDYTGKHIKVSDKYDSARFSNTLLQNGILIYRTLQ